MGKVTKAAKGELRFASGIYKYYADNGADLPQGRAAAVEAPGHGLGAEDLHRLPAGHHAVELPYYQVARFAAPNLMIATPSSSSTRRSALSRPWPWSRSFRDAGLPEDAYVNVFASNEQVADMIADPRVTGVS